MLGQARNQVHIPYTADIDTLQLLKKSGFSTFSVRLLLVRFIDFPLKSQRERQFRSLRAFFSFAAELLSARLWQLRLRDLELSALFVTILGFIPVSLVNISLGYPLSFLKPREALEGVTSSNPQRASWYCGARTTIFAWKRKEKYNAMDTLPCFEWHFCKYPGSHRPVAFTTKGGYVPQFIRVFIPPTHDTILFTTVLYFIR